MRNTLEERFKQEFTENERTFLKETEMDIVGAVYNESKYSNENERIERIVDLANHLLHALAIVQDWSIYLGHQQCKQCWFSGYDAWISCQGEKCNIYAEKSDKVQRTICCSVEYPWSKIMSPAEKKYHIENRSMNFRILFLGLHSLE